MIGPEALRSAVTSGYQVRRQSSLESHEVVARLEVDESAARGRLEPSVVLEHEVGELDALRAALQQHARAARPALWDGPQHSLDTIWLLALEATKEESILKTESITMKQ